MARGRAAGYDDQRGAILAQAAALFAARGYAATSMNQVALACGLSKATLYHYYRDKDALLARIAEDHVSRLVALTAQVSAQGLPPEPRLRALISGLLSVYAGAQQAHRVLTEDVRFLPDAPRLRILVQQRQVVAAVAQTLAELRPDLVPTRRIKPLAMLLFGAINWMFTWLRADGELSYADMAPLVADLMLGGLPALARPARRRG